MTGTDALPLLTFHVYKGDSGMWHWTAQSQRGYALAQSCVGYTRRTGAAQAVRMMERAFITSRVRVTGV